MEKAKQAVSGFLSKDGKHETTVHESVNPAVQNEHVTRTQHNEAQTAVDREVHQDHHHTSVQPVQDREVLPEQHTHKVAPTEHREVHHGNEDHTRQRLEAERSQFQDTREVGDVQHTHGTAGTVGGEHVHHHVHENIQPVIQKETVQPSVVHTTKPVHEVHHNEAKHHQASTLPTVSMSDFQKQGGSLGGSATRTDAFHGEPQSHSSGYIGGHGAQGTTSVTAKDGVHGSHAGHTHGTTGTGHTHGTPGAGTGTGTTTGTGTSTGLAGAPTTGAHGTKHSKPSLMDKLNPKKDADGDGKAGFLD